MKTKNLSTQGTINQLLSRISYLEREVLSLKKYFKFIERESDEKIWKKIRPFYQKVQEKIFQEKYPELYAKIKKEK